MSIFREYDIRGIAGKDLTTEVAESIGRAYATLAAVSSSSAEGFLEAVWVPEIHALAIWDMSPLAGPSSLGCSHGWNDDGTTLLVISWRYERCDCSSRDLQVDGSHGPNIASNGRILRNTKFYTKKIFKTYFF